MNLKLRKDVVVATLLWCGIMSQWGAFMIHVAGILPTEIATIALSCFGVGSLAAGVVVRFCGGRRAIGCLGLISSCGFLCAYWSVGNVATTALPLYAALGCIGASIMTAVSLANARIVKTCSANETGFVYSAGCACWIVSQASSPISPSCFLVGAGCAAILSVLGFAVPSASPNDAAPEADNAESANAKNTNDARPRDVRVFAAFLFVLFAVNILNTNFFFAVFAPYVGSFAKTPANVLAASLQGSEFLTVLLLGAILAKKPNWTRRVFIFGVAITAIRYFLYKIAGDAENEVLLLATSCGHGASYAILTSLVPTLCGAVLLKAADAKTTARGTAAIATAAMAAPAILAPLAARLVVESTAGWSGFWGVSGTILAVLTVLAALLLPRFETQAQEPTQDNADAA